MSDESLPRMHIDQVGALKRPQYLLDAFDQCANGRIDEKALRAAQDRSVRDIIAKQEAIGLPVVTDGEHRRRNFMQSYSESVAGFGDNEDFRTRAAAVERVRKRRNWPLEEFRFTCELTARLVKVTLLSLDRVFQSFAWEESQAVYPDIDTFAADAVAAGREMVSELVADGCRYISIDAPSYTSYLDEVDSAQMTARGEDPERNLARGLAADNAMIEGFPGVTFGMHLCRGGANRPGRYREGSYEQIAERLFNTLSHQRFLLEFDTERAGGFEPLRFVPKGRIVALGLVSTKLALLETADDLKRRIDEAAKFLPLEQLALCAACGFGGAPGAAFNRMTEEDQWRKLELMQEVVEDVWGTA